VRPNSKVILPYEPGYTGHWEMEKRRKETREWLRERGQQVRDRINTPSIVPRGVRFGRPHKLDAHQRQEALARLAAGETQADIARTYRVDATTIGRLQA
jgi:hypothetical protein